MKWATCIFVCVCIAHLADGQLSLAIQPTRVDVSEIRYVMITCSLNLLRPKTNVVYSIMIKRRGTTCAVVFRDGTYELFQNNIVIENTTMNTSYAVLQLKVKNVSCSDRGDYSCKMAVRRSYRNLQLGPVISRLTVTGKPSGIVVRIEPEKSVYNEGDKVSVTCSTLQRDRVTGWHWEFANQSMENSFDTCRHSAADCLYKCFSTISHYVSMDDNHGTFVCDVRRLRANRSLDVTNVTIKNDLPVFGDPSFTEIRTLIGVTESTNKQTYICIAVISITAVMTTFVMLILVTGRNRRLKPDETSLLKDRDGCEENHAPRSTDLRQTKSLIPEFWLFKTPQPSFQSIA